MKIILLNAQNADTKSGILIDRSSVLGNPFSHIPNKGKFPVDSREDAIRAYEDWITEKLDNRKTPFIEEFERLQKVLKDNKELILICHCTPLPCHGDILIKLLNERITYD